MMAHPENSAPALKLVQDWMQAVITDPAGIVSGMASDAARAIFPEADERPETVVCRSNSLTEAERLAVYGNAYWARLLDCLAEEFAAVKTAVSDAGFAAMTLEYLRACPSQSYTLSELGRRFPEFLKQTRPTDVPAPGWPDFVIDLATVERTYAEVFDGPGVETLPPLSSDRLRQVPPEEIGSTVFVAAPCLRLLELHYPVHEFITAWRKRSDREAAIRDFGPGDDANSRARSTYLVVTRRDYVVRRQEVDRIEFELLRQIVGGQTLAAAIELTLESIGTDVPDFEERLRHDFATWFAQQWLIGCGTRAACTTVNAF